MRDMKKRDHGTYFRQHNAFRIKTNKGHATAIQLTVCALTENQFVPAVFMFQWTLE